MTDFLLSLQKFSTPLLDNLFLGISALTGEFVYLAVLGIVYWCIDKDKAYYIGIFLFLSFSLNTMLKNIFCIPRPYTYSSVRQIDVSTGYGYSFPSGHTQSATTLYGYFAFTFKKVWLKIIFVAAFLLVGFSRLYLGVHTIYDVGVSITVSLLCVMLINLFGDIILNDKNVLKTAIVLGAASVTVCVLSFILALVGHADWEQINDCFKSGGAGLGFAVAYYVERKFIKFDIKKVSIPWNALKLVLGVGVAVAIKSLLKLILPGNLIIDFVRYFITIAWVVAIYPLIFTKFFDWKEKRKSSK